MVALIRYVVLAGIAIPLLRYTTMSFSPFVNNSIRYLFGGGFLMAIAIYSHRQDLIATLKNRKVLFLILINSILISIHMIFLLKGLSLSSSFTGSIFATLGFPISMLVAGVVYKEERQKLLSRSFLVGVAISFVGAGVFLTSQGSLTSIEFSDATFFFTVTLFTQAFQSVVSKQVSKKTPLMVSGALMSTTIGVFLFFITLFTGGFVELADKTWLQIFGLGIAGIYGMVVGMIVGFGIIKSHGIAVFNIMQLLIPVVTAIVGYIWLRETISLMQFYGSLIIIFGVYISLSKKKSKPILSDPVKVNNT